MAVSESAVWLRVKMKNHESSINVVTRTGKGRLKLLRFSPSWY